MNTLIENDYILAAKHLNCEVAAIKAVAEIESNGNGFLGNGLLVLRFEAHIFSNLTKGVYDKSNPDVSHKYIPNDPSNKGVTSDYKRLLEAKTLNPNYALQSCSFGKFQIMGTEFWRLGFESVRAFVNDCQKGEKEQLNHFVKFVISKKLDTYLRDKDWKNFAKGYNGSNYKINNYHIKIAESYVRNSSTIAHRT